MKLFNIFQNNNDFSWDLFWKVLHMAVKKYLNSLHASWWFYILIIKNFLHLTLFPCTPLCSCQNKVCMCFQLPEILSNDDTMFFIHYTLGCSQSENKFSYFINGHFYNILVNNFTKCQFINQLYDIDQTFNKLYLIVLKDVFQPFFICFKTVKKRLCTLTYPFLYYWSDLQTLKKPLFNPFKNVEKTSIGVDKWPFLQPFHITLLWRFLLGWKNI